MPLDRETALVVIVGYWQYPTSRWDEMLDVLAGCVTDEPQTIEWQRRAIDEMHLRHAAEAILDQYDAALAQAIQTAASLEARLTDEPQTIDRATFVQRYEALPGSDAGPNAETVADLAAETAWPDDEMQRQIDDLMRKRFSAQTIDRDALDSLLDYLLIAAGGSLCRERFDEYRDRILALLRPAPAQTIDRDALIHYLSYEVPLDKNMDVVADEIIALLRTVHADWSALLRPDARIAKLEALLRDDHMFEYMGQEVMYVDEVRAILRGEA